MSKLKKKAVNFLMKIKLKFIHQNTETVKIQKNDQDQDI